jgi:hypothetical protein
MMNKEVLRLPQGSETAVGRMGRAVLYLVLEHVMERSVKAAMAALL